MDDIQRAEFDRLYNKNYRYLCGVARKRMLNRDDIEDVMQDACVRAMKAFHGFDRIHSFTSWFSQIINNLITDSGRRARLVQFYSLDQVMDDDSDDHPLFMQLVDTKPPIDEVVIASTLHSCLLRAIDELPQNLRDAVYFTDVLDLDTQEASDVSGIVKGTIRSRTHKGRKILRQQFSELCG